jgi:hypothetical protein
LRQERTDPFFFFFLKKRKNLIIEKTEHSEAARAGLYKLVGLKEADKPGTRVRQASPGLTRSTTPS